jgi:hypothetical protein
VKEAVIVTGPEIVAPGVRLMASLNSMPSLFGTNAASYFQTIVLSASFTDQVPALAANANATLPMSAAVRAIA